MVAVAAVFMKSRRSPPALLSFLLLRPVDHNVVHDVRELDFTDAVVVDAVVVNAAVVAELMLCNSRSAKIGPDLHLVTTIVANLACSDCLCFPTTSQQRVRFFVLVG